jgi:hypothetical protein
MSDDTAPTFDEWAIAELMGHRRLAGRVREVQIAGAGFLRLDIPAAGDDPARTQFISPGSVYALHPVDEDTARAAAAALPVAEPVERWRLTALPTRRYDDEEAAEAMAIAADPVPDYGKDLDDEEEGPF